MSEYLKAPFTAARRLGHLRKLAGDAKAEIERLRAINAELVEACEAALNMVDGDGMPPDWYLLRAAIARAKP